MIEILSLISAVNRFKNVMLLITIKVKKQNVIELISNLWVLILTALKIHFVKILFSSILDFSKILPEKILDLVSYVNL